MLETKILVKNHKDNLISFIDYEGKHISEKYQEAIKVGRNYIVKLNGTKKWTILDSEMNKMINEEYDIFSSKLLSEGIAIFANLDNTDLHFDAYGYIKLPYILVDVEGLNVISSSVSENGIVYLLNLFYRFTNKDEMLYESFVDKLKKGDIEYLADKYYI